MSAGASISSPRRPSMERDPNAVSELDPLAHKSEQLAHFVRMLACDGIQDVDLVLDQRDVVSADFVAGGRKLSEAFKGMST